MLPSERFFKLTPEFTQAQSDRSGLSVFILKRKDLLESDVCILMPGVKRNYTLYTGLAKSTQRQSVSGIYKTGLKTA